MSTNLNYNRIATPTRVKPLCFTQKDEKSWEAETPVGRYFIDLDENYEIYSDIEEIGVERTIGEAISRANMKHVINILKCIGEGDKIWE